MEVKNKFNITLLISTILSVLGTLFMCVVLLFIIGLGGSLENLFSELTTAGDYTFFFLIVFFLFIIFIGIPIMQIYVLAQYHYYNKFHSTLALFISIFNMLSIPIGTILGIFMLIFRNEILKNKSLVKKTVKKK
jgi:hypothetical protein